MIQQFSFDDQLRLPLVTDDVMARYLIEKHINIDKYLYEPLTSRTISKLKREIEELLFEYFTDLNFEVIVGDNYDELYVDWRIKNAKNW